MHALLSMVSPLMIPVRRLRRRRKASTVARLVKQWSSPKPQELGYQDGECRTRYPLGGGSFLFAVSNGNGDVLRYELREKGGFKTIIYADDQAAFARTERLIRLGC
jgi:hypothetical protein